MVLLDVDSKQSESPLRGPPPAFVTDDFLKALRSIIHPRGVYVYVSIHMLIILQLHYIVVRPHKVISLFLI